MSSSPPATQGVKRVVYASSSSVYGDATKLPQVEEHTMGMVLSPYAATKSADEMFASVFQRTLRPRVRRAPLLQRLWPASGSERSLRGGDPEVGYESPRRIAVSRLWGRPNESRLLLYRQRHPSEHSRRRTFVPSRLGSGLQHRLRTLGQLDRAFHVNSGRSSPIPKRDRGAFNPLVKNLVLVINYKYYWIYCGIYCA